jgi:RNA polymerase sigma factor (TIGR02999 family)
MLQWFHRREIFSYCGARLDTLIGERPAIFPVFYCMSDVTRILSAIKEGDRHAAGQLLPVIYEELRKLAASRLAEEKPGQTLQATALVHEAFLRLVDVEKVQHWNSRGHFFVAAAEAMRRILVDNARRKRRPKQGGDRKRVELDEACLLTDERAGQLLLLDEALGKLAGESPDKAELVKLRYFGGLSHQEAARALCISRATADRHWAYARAFLYTAMEEAEQTRGI